MTKRVAFYVRVSTDGQTVENQLGELHAVTKRHGWQVIQIYADKGISGTKGREGRPEFDKLWSNDAILHERTYCLVY